MFGVMNRGKNTKSCTRQEKLFRKDISERLKILYMIESQTQKKIIDHLKKNGAIPIKIIKSNYVGISDLIVCFPDYPPIFLEVKQEKGKESEIQKYRREEFTSKGFTWIVTY